MRGAAVPCFIAITLLVSACGGDDNDGSDNDSSDNETDDSDPVTCGTCPAQGSCDTTTNTCVCNSGYGGNDCVDIDECATNNGDCDPRATCTNTAGSYTCGDCPTGTTGTGATVCLSDPPLLTAISLADPGVDTQQTVLTGVGFTSDAVATFNGSDVATTVDSDTSVTVVLPLPLPVGYTALTVRNSETNATASNIAWVAPSPTFFVLDFEPNVAPIAGTVKVVGTGFTDGVMVVSDTHGHTMTGGAVTTQTWQYSDVQAFPITIADGYVTDTLTVSDGTSTFVTRPLILGTNIAATATASASTTYEGYPASALNDGLLNQSWFSANGDCATEPTCTTVPWVELAWESPQTVSHLGLRGSRDYSNGYDVRAGTFTLYNGDTLLATVALSTDVPFADGDVTLSAPLTNVTRIRFTSTVDESDEPGIGEFVVY